MAELVVVGEPFVPGKPWLRRVGDHVVRFVQTSQDSTPKPIEAEGHLEKERDTLTSELQLLRKLGLDVVKSRVEVDQVPYFDGEGEPAGFRGGLRVDSEFISGIPLADFIPQEWDLPRIKVRVIQTYASLYRYLAYCRGHNKPFLDNIIGPHQHMVSRTASGLVDRVALADVDPEFTNPSTSNFDLAFKRLEVARDGLLEAYN